MRQIIIIGTSLIFYIGTIPISGCAIHYFDKHTGAEHIWGIGHMSLKASVPNEGLKAIVRETTLSGISIGVADPGEHLTIGWENRQSVEIIDEDTAIRLEWPHGDLLNLRFGSEWPDKPLLIDPPLKGARR